jgi:hypothetical protein
MPIDGANFAYLKTLAIDAARVFCAKASRSFDERDGRTHSYREIRRNLECLSYYLGNSLALIDDRSAEKVTIELLDFFEKHIHVKSTVIQSFRELIIWSHLDSCDRTILSDRKASRFDRERRSSVLQCT